MTKVGLWYVVFALVVAVAATNTGNNALFMVLAVMLAMLVVSGVVSHRNVRLLDIELEPAGEVFAKRPFALGLRLRNRGRFTSRFLVQIAVRAPRRRGRRASDLESGPPLLVAQLPPLAESRGQLEVLLRRRGRHPLGDAHVTSIFPLGFFRKGLRFPLTREVLVYPELFTAGSLEVDADPRGGVEPARRAGWGHELHALRAFRPGDDPRAIHWKQTARTGELVAMEREVEENRRLTVVFDNGVGKPADEAASERFERLVSEVATTAVDHLERGFEVELLTRGVQLAAAGGRRQRLAILEELALIEPVEPAAWPLAPERSGRVVRVGGSLERAA